MAQRIARLSSKSSLLLLCDMQEKFRPTIKYFPQIIETSNKLLQTCKILDVPYVVTEQYPKGSHYQQTYELILFYFK
jgi:nicotinamidase-related amidase